MQFQFNVFHRPHQTLERESLAVGDKSVPLLFVINNRARRYILRLRPDGTARVTIPRRGSFKAARQFAEKNVKWLQQQLHRLASRPSRTTAWHMGSEILFRGEMVTIVAGAEPGSIAFGEETIQRCDATQDLRLTIEQHMRSLAAAELPPRVFQFAHQHSLTVNRVTVRNQKSRWGSCSRRGTISLNWRLIQSPRFVSDYIILHELMHLRQMNHSRRFWREVATVCPEFRQAERWLKAHGRLL